MYIIYACVSDEEGLAARYYYCTLFSLSKTNV
jgi:hypothetical protein